MPRAPLTARRVHDLAALLRAMETIDEAAPDALLRKRHLVADLCRLIAAELTRRPVHRPAHRTSAKKAGRARAASPTAAAVGGRPNGTAGPPGLSPRMRETLQYLLTGDSEKQIARHMGVSRHTVHIYVKGLYRKFNVCSRGELLALFIPGENGARPATAAEPLPMPAGNKRSRRTRAMRFVSPVG